MTTLSTKQLIELRKGNPVILPMEFKECEFPNKKYKTIVADPAWQPTMAIINSPASKIGAPKASPQRHYKTLSVEEIEKLVPPSEEKSHLWLWVLSQHIDWGYRVARAWGFEPIQTITWCKSGLGVGRFQCNTEHVLLCRKGDRKDNPFGMTHGTWFNWIRGKHSKKPDDFYKLVEEVSPSPRLEMFARERRQCWDAWGNEIGTGQTSKYQVGDVIEITNSSCKNCKCKIRKQNGRYKHTITPTGRSNNVTSHFLDYGCRCDKPKPINLKIISIDKEKKTMEVVENG